MKQLRHVAVCAGLVLTLALLLTACGGATSAEAPHALPPQSLQSRFVADVKGVSSSVVEVETPVGLGSGVVLNTNGDVVTNAHVVGTYTKFAVTDSQGKQYKARLVGKFVPDDLAVIHVTGLRAKPLAFADSSQLAVGDIVLAVGNPLGLQSSVTEGIVSALGRVVTEATGSALPNVIQTSAAINPGNSGGALVNLNGQLVGIPTLTAIDPEFSDPAGGIGFAIPANTVKSIASQIARRGHVVDSGRAYLGVAVASPVSGTGVYVVSVVANGAAASAGIVRGDEIESLAGQGLANVDDLATTLAKLEPGERARAVIRTPAGKRTTVTVVLGQYPGS